MTPGDTASANAALPQLLTTEEASTVCGLAVSTLEKRRVYSTDGPPFVKLGRKVLYRRQDLLRWVVAHVQQPLPPAPPSPPGPPPRVAVPPPMRLPDPLAQRPGSPAAAQFENDRERAKHHDGHLPPDRFNPHGFDLVSSRGAYEPARR